MMKLQLMMFLALPFIVIGFVWEFAITGFEAGRNTYITIHNLLCEE